MTLLDDLTAEEVVMLGHCLRMVPANACLTGDSAVALGGSGFAMFTTIPAFKTLWSKTAAAISQRDDCEPFRVKTEES